MTLHEWISLNRLNTEIKSTICSIKERKFLILNRDEEGQLFDGDFTFIFTQQELNILDKTGVQEVLFIFGSNWYYSNIENVQLNTFKYIGEEVTSFDIPFPYLGVHGEYDLCNGTRSYADWCSKAKFLNSPSLGICENNTLAGTLMFQIACKNAKIKSILGETVTVSKDIEKSNVYTVKLFAKDYEGWVNLLNINAQIKVFNDGFVLEDYLLSKTNGLICVFSSDVVVSEKLIKQYSKKFKNDLYFQLDFTEWASIDKEESYLEGLKKYINNFISLIKPVLICDSFYLDKEHGHIKKILNTIGKVGFQYQSKDQYFKSLEDIYFQVNELAPDESWMDKVFFNSIENTIELNDKCNFEITLGELHLPQYERTEEEKLLYDTNEDLFYALITQGLERIKHEFVKPESEYLERVETEIDLISRGGFIDYFLITWDILNWCEKNDILKPVGRGSAAGSLVSYLLNITQLDPLKYNLLFERFLSEARILQSMPDIDNDLPSDRRDDVKRYMETRYGLDHVTSIGTYGTFKAKSGITDLAREANLDIKLVRYITSILGDSSTSFTELFKSATQINVVKSFLQEEWKTIENYALIKDQVKNSSIHAAGVIIVPKNYNGRSMTIYDWLPVKKIDGVLVTEWEGPQLEKAGYLKTDILGVKQLQKLAEIIKLINKNHNTKIQFKDIPLDDDGVYALFQEGYNEDVFQLGAIGLKGYCKELKPQGIEDLIATLALYRPGPMESGAHKDYIKIKNGLKEPEYDYMLEEVTKVTHSKFVYQEQIMQAVQVLGGFSLAAAEEVRSAMGKKIVDKMEMYKIQFIEGAIKKGCDQYEAVKIWNKLEVFAGYAFNRCISGDEFFYRASSNKNGRSSFKPTIKEMFLIKNNLQYAKETKHLALRKKYRVFGYGHSFSLNEKNKLIKNNIKDIRYAGVKPIYRVTVESGKTIDVTMNHKFPTSDGEKTLAEIDIINDLLYINQGFIQKDTSYYFGRESDNYPVKGTRGFQTKDTEYTKWKKLKEQNRLTLRCGICNSESSRLEMHHKDGNHGNNESSNVINLCVSCHKKEEYKLGRNKMGEAGLETSLEKIISILYLKDDDVYDVEMSTPYHTFTTKSGIVTSNSHSASYAHVGYYCQWLKHHFPLEFWSIALNFSSSDEISRRIAEMHKVSEVKVLPPDINQSTSVFEANVNEKNIYWSISSIKFIGETALNAIISERDKNGKFFSFEDFFCRVEKRAVNKRCIINLILSGCFDKVEKIEKPSDRMKLLSKFLNGVIPEEFADSTINWKDYFWILKQKELTGFGYLEFDKIYKASIAAHFKDSRLKYIDGMNFQEESAIGNSRCVVGTVYDITERKSKKGPFAEVILNCNDENVCCVIWAEIWPIHKEKIMQSKNKIMGITGKILYDDRYKKANVLQTIEQSQIYVL